MISGKFLRTFFLFSTTLLLFISGSAFTFELPRTEACRFVQPDALHPGQVADAVEGATIAQEDSEATMRPQNNNKGIKHESDAFFVYPDVTQGRRTSQASGTFIRTGYSNYIFLHYLF